MEGITGAAGEVARLRAELTALKAEFDQFRRHLPEAFVEVDYPGLRVTYMNQVARSLLGYSEEDVAAGLASYTLLDERSTVVALDVAAEQLALGPWAGKAYTREHGQRIYHMVMVRKDSSRFPADVQGSYVLDDRGMPTGVRYIFRDTTERTLAEQDRARLAAIVESSDDAIVSRALDGAVLSWNRGAERLYGYSAEEMQGRTLELLELPERAGEIASELRVVAAGSPSTAETRRRRRDGEVIDVSISLFPVRDGDGEVVAVGGVGRDIGERIRSAEALRRSNELLAGLAVAQTRFIQGDSARDIFEGLLALLLRLTDSEYGFIGEKFSRPDGLPFLRMRAITNIAWDQESTERFEAEIDAGMVFDRADSLFGRVLMTGEPLVSNDPANDPRRGQLPPGHPAIRAFLGLPIHVGDRLLGEVGIANRPGGYDEEVANFVQPFLTACGAILEALNIRRAREAAELRLELAMRGSDLSLWEWDVEHGTITAQFPDAVTHGHETEGEKDLAWLLERAHPDDREKLVEAFARHASGATATIENEHRILDGNGEYRWILTRGTIIHRSPAGRPLRGAGTFLDVTDRKLAEEERLRLEQQMRQSQKLESLGVFAGGIAHDFNNLLTAVLGNLYLLRGGLSGPEAELADEARTAAERGAELVRRLLSYARPEVSEAEHVALDRLVDETVALARSALTPQIQLVVHRGTGLAEVVGSWTSLQQVLLNLMVNARDAMPEGGRLTIMRRLVTVGPRHRWAPPELPRGRYYVISVSDTGRGMEPGLVERIFDPFFTTKDIGRGSGLGLPTALGIARAHGGWLAVESTPGKGSTFRLLLPAS